MSEQQIQQLYNQSADKYAKIEKINGELADHKADIRELSSESKNIRDDFEAYKNAVRWILGVLVTAVIGGLFL